MSKRWSLTPEQWRSFGKSLWKYTAPLLLVFFMALQAGTPINEALYIVYGAALQVAINFLSKFTTETK
jgi:hypothetical protein